VTENSHGSLSRAHQGTHWDRCQFDPNGTKGHYESYFLRGNHPSEPRAFWIRYTIFSPKGRVQDTVGEIWAIYFDGVQGRIVAVQQDIPLAECRFGPGPVEMVLGGSRLTRPTLQGVCDRSNHRIAWDLRYEGGDVPLFLLPQNLYNKPLPKAKALVGIPNTFYSGQLTVDGETIAVDRWQGSENHNWGSKHTDKYAWGQVSGFDNDGEAFLELACARVKLGPIWTPQMMLGVLRVGGQDFAFNSIPIALRSDGHYDFFEWHFDCRDKVGNRMRGQISAPAEHFTALRYKNPPGGAKTCINSKIARCEVTLSTPDGPPRTLTTAHRAAFEILTDRRDHGLTIVNPA